MCPCVIEIASKTTEKINSAQTNRHYENNGHLAVNQKEEDGGRSARMRDKLRGGSMSDAPNFLSTKPSMEDTEQ